MSKYMLSFWFDFGGICIWGMNDLTKEKFGYAIETKSLPLSNNLSDKIILLQEEYTTYLDWEYPPNPSPWTKKHKLDFLKRASDICIEIEKELGSEYELVNDVSKCII